MERLLSSTRNEINSPPEAFNQSHTQPEVERTTHFKDPAYPRHDITNDESIKIIPKRIVPIIPEGVIVVDESLKELKKFIDNPVTAEEIPNKEEFMQNVFPWIINALGYAGYNIDEVYAFLKKTTDLIDFNKPPEIFIADINRILNNTWKQVLEEKSKSTLLAPEAPTQPLVLTGENRVLEKIQPIVPVQVVEESILKNSLEKETVVDTFQNKFNALIEQPFNSDSYSQFYVEIHAALRDRYDSVTINAQNNLKRYSEFFTSSTEKEALLFFSTLKSQYVSLQSKNSSLGIVRAEIMNSLNRTDASINEETVKTFIQDYIDGTKNIFTNIDRLEEMITIAQGEEKPRIAEAYRAQFESMRAEGTKVLTTLPSSHPLYNEFKIVVEKGIGDLIEGASVEKGGDRAIGEGSSYFISLRNRVQAAIGYVKAEQEFENYKHRKLNQVKILELSLTADTKTLSPKKLEVKIVVLDNIAKIRQMLAHVGTLPQGVLMLSLSELTLTEATQEFVIHKEKTKELLGETNEILEGIQDNPVLNDELNGAVPVAESVIEYPPAVKAVLAPLTDHSNMLHAEISESQVSRVRLVSIRKLFKPARMGALALLSLAFSSGQFKLDATEGSALSLHTLMGMSAPVTPLSPTFILDRAAIEEYLKFNIGNTLEAKAQEIMPNILTVAPKLAEVATEVVPGVVFPPRDYVSLTSQSAPELKIYGAVDTVPADPGISFDITNQSEQGGVYTDKDFYTIAYGDTFWDINEGETVAGTLPVMSQINPFFKQHLIDRLRDALNNDPELRKKIGGFGPEANDLITGEKINRKLLNEEAVLLAINHGYLQ